MKPKRVALYIRVSSGDQNAEMQRNELTEYAKFRKWEVAETYSDTMSGAKDRRPALDRLMADAKRGKFEIVVVWRCESIDTSTPTGKMIFTILASVAELERYTIRERVIAGQKAAKRRGVRFGRPTVEVDTDHALKLRKQGLSWRAVAKATGVAKDTLIRHVTDERRV